MVEGHHISHGLLLFLTGIKSQNNYLQPVYVILKVDTIASLHVAILIGTSLTYNTFLQTDLP